MSAEKIAIYHKTVLIDEVLYYLDLKPNGIYVDATFGGGGHTEAILEHEPKCKVIALDWDSTALELNGKILKEKYGERLTLLLGNFTRLKNILKSINIDKINGILADFGTSQYQITQKPGFSFNIDSPLDMRMNPGYSKTTAYDIINKASQEELALIFWKFGQEKNSRKFAKIIIQERAKKGPIKTTRQLANIIETLANYTKKFKIHPATKIFQALRIVVNDELNNIKSLLTQAIDLLDTNGNIVCISFHSLEDQIVKNFFKTHKNILEILTPKVITASKEEIHKNISARSAKLRAAKKKY